MKMICNKIPHFNEHRFFKKIKVIKNDCWLWCGEIPPLNGYGVFYINKKQYKAHRISYHYFFGIKDLRKVIDHECMNKACVNPFHLREVTVRVNTQENSKCITILNRLKTHCVNGHEFTIENTYIQNTGVYGGKWRGCKICAKATKKRWHEKNK